jgi:hypothetical protein
VSGCAIALKLMMPDRRIEPMIGRTLLANWSALAFRRATCGLEIDHQLELAAAPRP